MATDVCCVQLILRMREVLMTVLLAYRPAVAGVSAIAKVGKLA